MKKREVYKLSPKDIGQIVIKTLNEARDYPIRRTVGPGEEKRYNKYRNNTRWPKGHRMSGGGYDIAIEEYGPLTIYISGDDSIKIACIDGRCYDQTDRLITREEAAQRLGVQSLDDIGEDGPINEARRPKRTIRLTESEMIEFIEDITKKIQRSKVRRRN